jgi:putative methionine-R-sulfoxide reductase with GAF domain
MTRFLLKYFGKKDKISITSDSLPIEEKEDKGNPVELKLKKIQSELDTSVKDIKEFSEKLLSSFSRIMGISQGAFFLKKNIIKFLAGFAYPLSDTENLEFEFGQGLSGQVALDGKMININSIPEGYITIVSGLGEGSPGSMIIFPVLNKKEIIAVIELASFQKFTNEDEELIRRISPIIAQNIIKFNK